MPTYRLHLEYDGTEFNGWQVQTAARTVQGVLDTALGRLCGEAVRTVGAGRTDAGVHALGQVASFTTGAALEPARLLAACAGLLPADARVWGAGRTRDGFSARHDARSRHYRYRLRRAPSVFARRWTSLLPYAVDVSAMREAVTLFAGEHDFTAFAATDSAGRSRRCLLFHAAIEAESDDLVVHFSADRFLHHMVRRLVGTLVEVGRGRRTVAEVQRALETGDATLCGPSLPACGLTLVDVGYPPDEEFAASAQYAAPPRSLEDR